MIRDKSGGGLRGIAWQRWKKSTATSALTVRIRHAPLQESLGTDSQLRSAGVRHVARWAILPLAMLPDASCPHSFPIGPEVEWFRKNNAEAQF
jgi:hypothetical protein